MTFSEKDQQKKMIQASTQGPDPENA